ncbi:MAG: histidine phosphatase family protein [Defluviitaleaceae bacterium]|nr:histidine phosphatase family protein [Defluviitaleaceae bacterium]
MIYLLRHGQTDLNLANRFNGSMETNLNKTGIEQAKLQAENLKGINFDVCFCSPRIRARQFCEIIYKGTILIDDRLSEIICGEFEGMEETAEMLKSFYQAVQIGDKGTERFDLFIERNCDFCDLIAQEYKGKNVLIVTHAANARVINYYFTGKPKDYDFKKAVAANNEILKLEN